jgi:phage gp36-like protein
VYATKSDMISRYGLNALVQATDITSPQVGEIVDRVLDARLFDAACEIDSYLAGRTTVPMPVPPAHIKDKCCLLAMAKLLGDTQSDAMRADVRAARDYLAAVAKGSIALEGATALPGAQGAGGVDINVGTKVFGREL